MTAIGASIRSLWHRAAIVGIGETVYYKRGQSPDPEFVLALKAILAACILLADVHSDHWVASSELVMPELVCYFAVLKRQVMGGIACCLAGTD